MEEKKITEEEKNAEVICMLKAFSLWKLLPNKKFDACSVKEFIEIIRWFLETKKE